MDPTATGQFIALKDLTTFFGQSAAIIALTQAFKALAPDTLPSGAVRFSAAVIAVAMNLVMSWGLAGRIDQWIILGIVNGLVVSMWANQAVQNVQNLTGRGVAASKE